MRKSSSLLSCPSWIPPTIPVCSYFYFLFLFFFRLSFIFFYIRICSYISLRKKNNLIFLSLFSSPLLSSPLLSSPCLLKSLLSFVSFLLSSPSFCLLPVVLLESILLHPALPLSHHLPPHSPVWSPLKFHLLCSFLLSSDVLSSLSSPALSPSPLLSSPLLLYVMDSMGQCAASDSDSLCHCSESVAVSTIYFLLPSFIGGLLRSLAQVCRRNGWRVVCCFLLSVLKQ